MNKPTIDIYQGIDGAWVVHVDTDAEGGQVNAKGPCPLRVYINDGVVYENPKYPTDISIERQVAWEASKPSTS